MYIIRGDKDIFSANTVKGSLGPCARGTLGRVVEVGNARINLECHVLATSSQEGTVLGKFGEKTAQSKDLELRKTI